jgi:hypothetical protein
VRPAAVAIGLLGVTVALGSAHGQGGPRRGRMAFTAGAGLMYGNLIGGDFGATRAAVGFDANAGVVLRRWQLCIGYDRTNHGRSDTDGDYIVSNVYVEPRLLFGNARARWAPYAALRAGRAMASYVGILGITDKATGYVAALGAGLVWRVSGPVQADAAAHYARLSHDYGTGGYAAAEKGGQASVRLGLRLSSR